MILKNGIIADGISNTTYTADIKIQNNKIIQIQKNIPVDNEKTYDVTGKYVLPGFVDFHSHSDLYLLFGSKDKNIKLLQGVTTEIIGNCGLSVAPIKKEEKNNWEQLYSGIWGDYNETGKWEDFPEYLKYFKKIPNNIISLVGYGALRNYLVGAKSKLSKDELYQIKTLLKSYLEAGAKGLSLGLLYSPCCNATEQELIEITEVLRENDILAVHMRNEGDDVVQSLKEIIEIAKKSQVNLEISHLKTYGKQNWKYNDLLLELIENAAKYININFDQYPYTAGSTVLNSILPQWLLNKGIKNVLNELTNKDTIKKVKTDIEHGIKGWENYYKLVGPDKISIPVLNSSYYKKYSNKSIAEISKLINKEPLETAIDIIIKEHGKPPW